MTWCVSGLSGGDDGAEGGGNGKKWAGLRDTYVKWTGPHEGSEMRTQERELKRMTFRLLFYRTKSIVVPFTEPGNNGWNTTGLEGKLCIWFGHTTSVIPKRRGQPRSHGSTA